jgi:O-acetyl-ADP-ribose deacetylase (regulator of RNase III)
MKIEYRKGNLFKTDIYTIVHGCNAQGVMGSGVAKIVYDDYRYAYDEYWEHHSEYGLTLGEIICVPCNGKMIVNAITQDNFGRTGERFVSYDAVALAMHRINKQWRAHSE